MHFPAHLILELWRYADFSVSTYELVSALAAAR
jgi:hypothetical protein